MKYKIIDVLKVDVVYFKLLIYVLKFVKENLQFKSLVPRFIL